MKTAKLRNKCFAELVRDIHSLPFGRQVLILTTFARSHGVRLVSDVNTWELWARAIDGRALFKVNRHPEDGKAFRLVEMALPAEWALALVNCDYSGMTASEAECMRQYLETKNLQPAQCVTAGDSYTGRHEGVLCLMCDYLFHV